MDDAASQTQAVERQIGPDERLMTLTEATGLLPRIDGKKVAVCTLWRWCRKGLRGKYLDYVRVGRRICTTREALLRFFTDLAELDERVEPDRYATPPSVKRAPICEAPRSLGEGRPGGRRHFPGSRGRAREDRQDR